MKVELISLESGKEKWFTEASELYAKKLKPVLNFSHTLFKAKNLERKQSDQKKELESALLLSKIKSNDYVILCEERGKSFDSIEFSTKLRAAYESGSSRVLFVVGGAYGVNQDLRSRANLLWSFSPMVMNHMLAQVVALEQIYRATTIWKGTPYHNE
ncbi:MAG: 23S rRNA (pseudouridine(1915)-N(3))-methyltransferase RlmH [Bdellovibrionales bacterium]